MEYCLLWLFCSVFGPAPALGGEVDTDTSHKKETWEDRFTFNEERPGIYTVDPHVWIYTKEFAVRFGMPEKWISNELRGVAAAAWRYEKTGSVGCGWGGKKDLCIETKAEHLELYIDTSRVSLPWAEWSLPYDILNLWSILSSVSYLTPQNCEHRREFSPFLTWKRPDYACAPVGVWKQPFSDPETGREAPFYVRSKPSAVGFRVPLQAYEKQAYPGLAWVQLGYDRPVGSFVKPSEALLSIETRDSNYSNAKTMKKFHEIFLPKSFDERVVNALVDDRFAEQKLYEEALR